MLLKLQLSNYQSSSTTNIIIKSNIPKKKPQTYFSPSGKEQLHSVCFWHRRLHLQLPFQC